MRFLDGAIVFTLLSWCNISAQSPFTQSKAGFYAQVGTQAIPAYRQVRQANAANIKTQGIIREYTTDFYGEYGFNAATTGVIQLPFRYASRTPRQPTDPAKAAILGISNITLGLKRGCSIRRILLAGSLLADLPAGNRRETGLRTGFNAFTIRPLVSVGQALRHKYWYIYSSYGYRSNKYAAFIHSGVEGGVHFGRFWGIGYSEWRGSLRNGDRPITTPTELTGLFADEQAWLSAGLKLIVSTGRFTGFVFTTSGAFSGNNVAYSPAFSLSYFFKWD